MRSKPDGAGGYDHNSYESPDSVNQIRWDRKVEYYRVFEYYQTLINIRKALPHFRMNSAADILANLEFLDTDAGMQGLAYRITGGTNAPDVIVIHSGNPRYGITGVTLDAGKTYNVLTNSIEANINGIETISNAVYVPANTTMILVEELGDAIEIKETSVTIEKGASFDPASNVEVLNDSVDIYYSNYHDVDVPGRYTITIAVQSPYTGYQLYFYTLYVGGQYYNVTLNEGSGE
jgi:pullulanase